MLLPPPSCRLVIDGQELGTRLTASGNEWAPRNFSPSELLALASQIEDRLSPLQLHAVFIAREAAREFGVQMESVLCSPRAGTHRESAARHVTMMLLGTYHPDVKDRTIARIFNRERSNVPVAKKIVRDLYDADVKFRASFDRIQTRVRARLKEHAS